MLTGSLSSLVKYISTANPSTGLQDKDILQQLLGTIILTNIINMKPVVKAI